MSICFLVQMCKKSDLFSVCRIVVCKKYNSEKKLEICIFDAVSSYITWHYMLLWLVKFSLFIEHYIYVCCKDISVMHKVKLQIFIILLIKNMKHIFMLPDKQLCTQYNIEMIWHSFYYFSDARMIHVKTGKRDQQSEHFQSQWVSCIIFLFWLILCTGNVFSWKAPLFSGIRKCCLPNSVS